MSMQTISTSNWIPIHTFRERYQLPMEFGVSLFVAKDFTGRGSIHQAGEALQQFRQSILAAVPSAKPATGWIAVSLELQRCFTRLLWQINPAIGLQSSEIEYATAGFGDVIQAYLFALLQAQVSSNFPSEFEIIYQQWLDQSILISAHFFPYQYRDELWKVQLLQTHYGLSGLLVKMSADELYVYDPVFGCPVEGFMKHLLRDCAARLKHGVMRE